jgi:hypothetical protein
MQFNLGNPNYGLSGTSTSDGGYSLHTQPSEKTSDVFGRQKVTIHQNVYEADFEYGSQPLRWETLTYGLATSIAVPSLGGVQMSVSTGSNDIAIRQTRPYHRYQPGKSMYMAANVNFGAAVTNQFQRVGFFDDSNGAFFEQGSPSGSNNYGMYVCLRSNASAPTGSLPVTTRVPITQWNGDIATAASLNWNNVQMVWIEYAWYGAGIVRFGVTMNGEQYVLHTFNTANVAQGPWSRTGNLPVRYEIRNSGSVASGTTFTHYGVSVVVEGGRDAQRGFTYSYGMNPQQPTRTVPNNSYRYPVLSIQNRTMGTQEYTQANSAITSATTSSITVTGNPWTGSQWVGKAVYFLTGSQTGLIVSSSTNTISFVDVVSGLPMTQSAQVAGAQYTLGYINRGQILPLTMVISSNAICAVELISSTPGNPVVLTGSNFVPLSTLGSSNSFANRDISATGLNSGSGEVVYAFISPSGGSGLQTFDLSNFFPLYNTIKGNLPDILTVAVTTSGSAAQVGVHLIGQEAMS